MKNCGKLFSIYSVSASEYARYSASALICGLEIMANQKSKQIEDKRAKVSQGEFPNVSLKEALRIANALWDQFAGKSAAPHDVAMALELSPTSGGWRNLCGASIAYGLTDGGYAAPVIALSPLGRRIVAPTEEGDDLKAIAEALLRPRIQKEFLQKYDRAKFPRDDIAENVLVQLGLPRERAKSALVILKQNGNFAGIVKETKTGPFVALNSVSVAKPIEPMAVDADSFDEEDATEVLTGSHETVRSPASAKVIPISPDVENNRRVFITHGKNTRIMEQIKKLVGLGGFTPVVSVQRETPAKPVPEKVMDDMRSCGAAVIHVGTDGTIRDADGVEHPQLNPNVLIEIGAAMALYKGRFILVVESGVKLPSNLQGLYECRYVGDGLDMDAGMKILEALRGLS